MVFGGIDTLVGTDEALMMEVVIARLYFKIYDEYWMAGRKLDFLALGVTLDHADLQRLLFDESSGSKKQVFFMLAAKSTKALPGSGVGSQASEGMPEWPDIDRHSTI